MALQATLSSLNYVNYGIVCDAMQVKCINDRDVFDACEISDA